MTLSIFCSLELLIGQNFESVIVVNYEDTKAEHGKGHKILLLRYQSANRIKNKLMSLKIA